MTVKVNPFADRMAGFVRLLRKRRLEAALVCTEPNVKALTGIDCDNAIVVVRSDGDATFYTDFRYIPMVERTAPWIRLRDISKFSVRSISRLGFEEGITVEKYGRLQKKCKGAEFFPLSDGLAGLRAVKTACEADRLRASAKLNDEIWNEARKSFRPGMTEKAMARVIRHLMIEKGDGEAFETIVCVGANAAECHHVPDDTVWTGDEPVLVDMGVKLDGYCSDMTRNIVPESASRKYRRIYRLILEANKLGIREAKPGMKASELDMTVRNFLKEKGFEKEFGHSLGHGVGIEIHEHPGVSRKSKAVLEPGMAITIEPGIYIPGELGVRIEDLILIAEKGCEVISHSAK